MAVDAGYGLVPGRNHRPLDGEALPASRRAPADIAVAKFMHRSSGELTAWDLTHTADTATATEKAGGI